MWMSNCLRNTLIHNAVMYLISHPLMVLPPSSRDYPGEAGGGHKWKENGVERRLKLFTEENTA